MKRREALANLLNCMQQDQPSEGLFTEGCFALVEGDYTEDATLSVIAVGHPPCESRESARYISMEIWCIVSRLIYYRSIYGHIDFLGKGATTLLEDVRGPVPRRLCIDTDNTP